jgi:heme-degrading monooxygenase HmoA
MQFARVSRYSIAPERMDEACEAFRQALSNVREIDGNEGAFFLVDRENGVAMTITLWDGGGSLDASEVHAAMLRRTASSAVEADIEAVERYEIPVELG